MLACLSAADVSRNRYGTPGCAATDAHKTHAEIYRYTVEQYLSWSSLHTNTHICQETEMLCPLYNLVAVGDPPSGWKLFCSPLFNTLSVSAPLTFIFTHTLHHPVQTSVFLCFCNFHAVFISAFLIWLTNTRSLLWSLAYLTTHPRTLLNNGFVNYIHVASLALSFELWIWASLWICLCLRLHTWDSDVVVQAALWEVASVCHRYESLDFTLCWHLGESHYIR